MTFLRWLRQCICIHTWTEWKLVGWCADSDKRSAIYARHCDRCAYGQGFREEAT